MSRTGRPKKLPKGEKFFKKSFKFPYMREYMDFDYIEKLSASERQWLSEFAHGWYQSGNTLPEEMQREAWRSFKAASRDMYSRNAAFGRVEGLATPTRADPPPTRTPGEIEDDIIDRIDAERAQGRKSAEPDEIIDEIMLKAWHLTKR